MSYTIGQSAKLRKTITEADIILFAGISGDANPVHIDEVAARESRFGRRIAHGMLGAGLISAVIGMHLPGPGTIYLNQNLAFRSPIYIGDTVTAYAEIKSLRDDKPIATLITQLLNEEGKTLIEGEAIVLLPS
ncbi:MaoC family dehydratase [Herpetosiphon giganteus]|uniref:MaoC family dehydratase n=1 Tax=Herpetosiphon giganteus TaxID=2029754 RepID=UPI001959C764|nr:MaoC family dehydratase [Herpetosiphon giganteus]MBM7841429.1 3-hydroxybutyryl-CoA dehydratase [Herpetosiphon giganteus]